MSDATDLERAYVETIYWVDALPEPIALRIGEHSRVLDRLLVQNAVQDCAIVTAWNPHSEQVTSWRNVARQASLLRSLRIQGYRWVGALGEGDDGAWPAEPGALVLGMRKDAALRLGRRFAQHAVVIVKLGCKPALAWCARQF